MGPISKPILPNGQNGENNRVVYVLKNLQADEAVFRTWNDNRNIPRYEKIMNKIMTRLALR